MADPVKPRRSLMKLATPLMIGRGISAVLTFTIPIVLARHMPRDLYGTYKQFFLIAATVYLIGQIGFPASLYYFLPRRPADRGRHLIQCLLGLFVVGGVAATIVGLAGGAIAGRMSNPELAHLTLPLALYVWAFLGAAPLEISLTAVKKTTWSGAAYVVSDLVRTASLTVPMLLGWGIHGLAWCAVGFATLRLVVAWSLALGGAAAKPALPTRRTLREQLRYSVPFAGAVLLATVQMQFPQYAVAALTDAATYAIYAVGVLQIPLADMLYTPVAEVMMVRLAQADDAGAPPIFREAMARLAIFFLPLTAFALGAAPELVPTLYTTRYLASVPIFVIALFELPLSGLPVDGLLRALDCTRTIFLVNLGRLAFTLVAVPLGLWVLGLPGAMLAYVCTQWLAKLSLLRMASRRLGVTARSLVPWREVGGWAGRAVVIFAVVTALRVRGPWHHVKFIIAAVAASGVIWLISVVTAGELRRKQEPAEASAAPVAGASVG